MENVQKLSVGIWMYFSSELKGRTRISDFTNDTPGDVSQTTGTTFISLLPRPQTPRVKGPVSVRFLRVVSPTRGPYRGPPSPSVPGPRSGPVDPPSGSDPEARVVDDGTLRTSEVETGYKTFTPGSRVPEPRPPRIGPEPPETWVGTHFTVCVLWDRLGLWRSFPSTKKGRKIVFPGV